MAPGFGNCEDLFRHSIARKRHDTRMIGSLFIDQHKKSTPKFHRQRQLKIGPINLLIAICFKRLEYAELDFKKLTEK